ncbi:MAG: hypothetical protein DID90_2727553114 [Candidatus Nitrotoga sp. LAW]|nr:MAG: hypothetical protein DID91_2727703208 [Candidatus Nitrotoga sp. MKT]RFC37884.1 MAG: hypothetical protein DID90_2727553114 [Candidatus Nitrotoga sp. LAW]
MQTCFSEPEYAAEKSKCAQPISDCARSSNSMDVYYQVNRQEKSDRKLKLTQSIIHPDNLLMTSLKAVSQNKALLNAHPRVVWRMSIVAWRISS